MREVESKTKKESYARSVNDSSFSFFMSKELDVRRVQFRDQIEEGLSNI